MNEHSRKKSRNVTIIDVARESGVSYSTVSRVLSGFEFVKESTRQRVIEAADKLGYVANAQARSLAGGRSQIIGLLVPGLDNGYVGEIVRGIDEELAKANYDLMLFTTHRQRGKESTYVNTLINGLTDGLLMIVPLVASGYIDALHERQFPYVLIDQTDPTNRSTVVDTTNRQAAYEATDYLIGLGHRRIGFIKGLMEIHSAIERFEGYKAALNDHHIPFLEELTADGDFWQPTGYDAGNQLLSLPESRRPTAIFASNDLSAFGILEAARERGLEIPRDLSVIGFDDIQQASMVHPRLTTVRQPLEHIGQIAVKLLLDLIENPDLLEEHPPRRVTLATRIVIRDSCCAIQERG